MNNLAERIYNDIGNWPLNYDDDILPKDEYIKEVTKELEEKDEFLLMFLDDMLNDRELFEEVANLYE